ncbi:ABC transporter substrate-binding protein [Thermoanaerobacterium sp. RBIITD]|uniref:ABC transporter substrate-binding protein n=1 Tax=Thermoanaerobacterium sp. RBIITD TaxID=1550240 RepID=UPI000BB97CF2|nr:ABC transporter substrate-binding protein [Thermoanaerobacterium sp. RBIITD]SNX53910.1 ABC-type glycerol-3-phosphate transport system, substrate-binding protein [Thermoanaerobacterium sp. RBIITD]
MKVKKLISLLVTTTVISTSLAGCAKTNDSNNNKTSSTNGQLKGSITVLTHRTDMTDVFNKYAEEFQKLHPGTIVKFENLNDYQNAISTRMSTGNYGDVLMLPANITKDKYKDFFAPLGTRKELSKTYNYLDNFDVNGTIYGIPTGANATGFVYNEKVLKEAGVTSLPTTPEEYINMLKAIKEKTDAIPYYTNYTSDWALTNFSNALQIGISGDIDYMNKMIYNPNEFIKGSATYTSLDFLYEAVKNKLVEQDPMTSDWERSKQEMADGKIGVMCLGSWAIGQIQAKSKTPEDIKFMPVPVRHDGKAVVQVGPDYGMGVNVHSKNIELAKEFLKFFITKYPKDSNMFSPIVGASLPDYLSGASDIKLVEAKPGTTQQAKDLDTVQKVSLINLNDGTWIKKIIEIGLGVSNETFDQYMSELNSKWAKGVKAVGK